MAFPDLHLAVTLPEIVLLATSLVVLIVALFIREEAGGWLSWVALAGIVAAAIFQLTLWPGGGYAFLGAIVADPVAITLNLVILAAAFSAVLTARREVDMGPDYLSLTLWAAIGMMVLVGATNLMSVFLGVEILSLPLYILAGFNRKSAASAEAATKYLLLGAFSSGFLLYGLALIYGATGHVGFQEIAQYYTSAAGHQGLISYIGLGLVIVGLGFKLGLVPFHMWVPDVYEGAPTPVTAFMSVGTKVAAFAALMRVLLTTVPLSSVNWLPPIWFLAVLTMLAGSLLALPQTNLKRLLGYSGIANAGYLLAAISADSAWGIAASVFFLAAYALMNLGAFAVISALSPQGRDEGAELSSLKGLVYRKPGLAIAMIVFLLSLASIPPTAGFLGKFYVLQAVINSGAVVVGLGIVVATAITLYVYLRPIFLMFQPVEEDGMHEALRVPPALGTWITLLVLATLEVGIYPHEIIGLVHQASGILVGF